MVGDDLELLFEILFEVIIGGSLEGANDSALPKWLRICLLIFASVIYAALTVLFVWQLFIAKDMVLKIILGGVVALFIGLFVVLWCRLIRTKASK